MYGEDIVHEMCARLNIDLIARAHQVVQVIETRKRDSINRLLFHHFQDGYEFFGNKKLVTIFSAPYYCGQFDNYAATMKVSAEMNIRFTIYKYIKNEKRSHMKERKI